MIGKALQSLLNQKGMNVNELSKMIGVSNQTLYSIIKRDNMKIDFEILLKICKALNVSVEYFYSDYYKDTYTNTLTLNEHEQKVITAYRNHPEMQQAVDTLLHVSGEDSDDDFIAEDIAKTIKAGERLGKLNGCTEKK